MNLDKVNEYIAITHMQKLMLATVNFRNAPNQRIKDDCARKARVEAKLLEQSAAASDNAMLRWAANEARSIIETFHMQDTSISTHIPRNAP